MCEDITSDEISDSSSQYMGKRNRYFLIYIFIILLVILLIFEFMVLPWYFRLPRDLALMGFAASPNITVDDTFINSIGFTGDVIRNGKTPGTIRILTLGGSVIFNRRMTARMKVGFEAVSGRPVEIMGGALRTHTSMSSLIKYKTLSKYKFDYALIYHGINDLFVNNVDRKYFKSDYSHLLPWYKRNFLLDHSLFARIIYNNFIWGKRIFGMEKIWYIYPGTDRENIMEFISEELLRNNILSLVKKMEDDNVVPVLMTFAWNIPDNYSQESFVSGTVGFAPTTYGRYPVARDSTR